MRWDPRSFERTPSTLHRVTGIVCGIVCASFTAAMCVLLALHSPTTAPVLFGLVFFATLFGMSCWLLYRFVFTPARAHSPRAARWVFAFSAACLIATLVMKLFR